MKKTSAGVSILGIVVISITLFVALKGSSRQQKSEGSSKIESDAELYKELYIGRIISDLAMSTAILQRIDQDDLKTAKNVMIIRLKADLDMVNRQTNYFLSEEQKKAKRMAEDYRKKIDKN